MTADLTAGPTAALRFSSVSKRYGAFEALRNVSFEVPAGCVFGLAGVNGAGKTTLIKCLLDLASAGSGTIEIFGLSSIAAQARARLAFLPERFTPPYYLTGRDFLRMMAGLRGAAYDDAAAHDMLEALDMDPETLERPVKAYSKGMTQKIGLAASFLAECDLAILDEPMSGLDPKARARVKVLLADLKARCRTVFMTSHALADIDEVCDAVGVLHDGQLRYIGTPAHLRSETGSATLEQAFLAVIEGPAHVAAGEVA